MSTLVLMAAGAGSRFGGPKQTTPVGPHGEWLLDYALYDAKRAGFTSAVCIIREELRPQFDELAARVRGHLAVQSVVQRLDDLPAGAPVAARTKPWGTGHAILTVRSIVTTPFAIINADDFYGRDAYVEGASACRQAARDDSATVVAMRLDRTLSAHGPVKRGWAQTRDGKVMRLEEVMGIERRNGRLEAEGRHAGTTFDGSELVSMNFWVFAPSIFGLMQEKFDVFLRAHRANKDAEFLLPEVVNELIAEGRLVVHAKDAPGPWFGLTYREDLEEVSAGLKSLHGKGVYPAELWKG